MSYRPPIDDHQDCLLGFSYDINVALSGIRIIRKSSEFEVDRVSNEYTGSLLFKITIPKTPIAPLIEKLERLWLDEICGNEWSQYFRVYPYKDHFTFTGLAHTGYAWLCFVSITIKFEEVYDDYESL